MKNQEKEIPFQEKNQSFWQLGLILSSGFGLVSTMAGGQVAKIYGVGTAKASIFLGNFILWFIALAIISMTRKRAHAIQNIEDYLGKFSASIATVIVAAAFVIWYALQIKIPAQVPIALIQKFIGVGNVHELKIGAAIGSICALLSIGGIKTIKWINIISFPILIISLIMLILNMDHVTFFEIPWEFSFSATLLIILTWLPGTINLSTFFRHSRSRSDSILGLTLMMIFHSLFQYCFVFLNISDPTDFIGKGEIISNITCLSAIVAFIFFSFLCVNLLNIYWASVGLEVFFRHRQEAKGCVIIGLLGTVIYVFFQSSVAIAFLEGLGTACIVNLGVVLIIGHLVKVMVQHRARNFDKPINAICWFISCFASIIFLSLDPENVIGAILIGINACILSFGAIIFLEEIKWSIKNLGNR
jgi:uncharacterized integral membrane protein